MSQYFVCAGCGAEIEIELELGNGESQRAEVPCADCGRTHGVSARFNYAVNEFELEIDSEDDG